MKALKKIIAMAAVGAMLATSAARAETADNNYPYGIVGNESIDKMACIVASNYDAVSLYIEEDGYEIRPISATMYDLPIYSISVSGNELSWYILVTLVDEYNQQSKNRMIDILADSISRYGSSNYEETKDDYSVSWKWDGYSISVFTHKIYGIDEVMIGLTWYGYR